MLFIFGHLFRQPIRLFLHLLRASWLTMLCVYRREVSSFVAGVLLALLLLVLLLFRELATQIALFALHHAIYCVSASCI